MSDYDHEDTTYRSTTLMKYSFWFPIIHVTLQVVKFLSHLSVYIYIVILRKNISLYIITSYFSRIYEYKMVRF